MTTQRLRAETLSAICIIAICACAAQAQDILPPPDPAFDGQIGRTAAESISDFPEQVTAPEGAPNVVLIMCSS